MEKKYYFCTVKTATKYKIFGSPRWDSACSGPFLCTFFAKNHNGQSPKPLFPKERSTFSYHYTFTGKELDSETGYSYFGARYYDAELSGLFFSVDPMADKYPNMSSYAYCAWNPLKLIDPNGMLFDSISENKYIKPYENEVQARIAIIDELRETDNWKTEYEDQYKEYKTILEEITMLRNDQNNIYSIYTNVFFDDETIEGELRYSGLNSKNQRKLSINLSTKYKDVFLFLGTLSHELKHAYQYYDKQLGFVINDDGIQISSSNSQELEKAAFVRGEMFESHNVTNRQKMRFDYGLTTSKYVFPQGSCYLLYPSYTNVYEYSSCYGTNFIYNNH